MAYESELGSKGHLSDLERGLTRPTVSTLKVLADRLGVALLDLVTFPDEDERQRRIDRERASGASAPYGDGSRMEERALGLTVAEPNLEGVARELGGRIRDARLRAELSEDAVAARAGLDPPQLRAIESGVADVTVRALGRIAAAIGLDFWDLVGGR
ncbi:hypothetical protein AKJ08_0279 [Vulgatibacter incomptus]|uniref:HTH cro/C1-type domain-containing protein n=1 Tax=Vulgatibacter incomptus TaxID=1391653 RepID=A0A0K1P8R1_9BACT|nr:hypothetical protein AKJ08_0279 [Vulgatibacter incomptus]